MQEWRVHESQTHQHEVLITDRGQAIAVRTPKIRLAGFLAHWLLKEGNPSLLSPVCPRKGFNEWNLMLLISEFIRDC